MKITIIYKGGPGSGNYGHEGRPGKLGGSSPGKGGSKPIERDEHAMGIIQWGYEQSISNEEGMVDFGDAVRLYTEDTGVTLTDQQLRMAKRAFIYEFPRNRSQEARKPAPKVVTTDRRFVDRQFSKLGFKPVGTNMLTKKTKSGKTAYISHTQEGGSFIVGVRGVSGVKKFKYPYYREAIDYINTLP